MDDARLPWHSLLGPLPPDATVDLLPDASASGADMCEVDVGQRCLVSAAFGHDARRTVLVVLDAGGKVVGASDTVDRTKASPTTPTWHHREAVVSEFLASGVIRGHHWVMEGPEESVDSHEEPSVVARELTPEEGEQLYRLAVAIAARASLQP